MLLFYGISGIVTMLDIWHEFCFLGNCLKVCNKVFMLAIKETALDFISFKVDLACKECCLAKEFGDS